MVQERRTLFVRQKLNVTPRSLYLMLLIIVNDRLLKSYSQFSDRSTLIPLAQIHISYIK